MQEATSVRENLTASLVKLSSQTLKELSAIIEAGGVMGPDVTDRYAKAVKTQIESASKLFPVSKLPEDVPEQMPEAAQQVARKLADLKGKLDLSRLRQA